MDENSMRSLDDTLSKKIEQDLKELRNNRCQTFAKKIEKELDSKMKVMVKISPTSGSVHIAEALHFNVTCKRSIHVKSLKQEISSMLGCSPNDFRLLVDSSKSKRRLRDEEDVLEVLQKTNQKWPAPYQGLVWVEL